MGILHMDTRNAHSVHLKTIVDMISDALIAALAWV